MFEPNHLAATHLVDAYAQVVPTLRRLVNAPVAAVPLAGGTGNAASSKRGGRS